ncbi:MAG: cyanophycinase [Candidatus Aminicenantes bacterium]|nr:cyanophycinase [Candidatus Aminicenantes bacterium]
MRRSAFPVLFLALLTLAGSCAGPAADAGPQGRLFIVGGGDRDAPLMRRFVELAEGFGTGRIVVFTMASGVPLEVGPETVAELRSLGAAEVVFHQLTRDEAMDPASAALLDGAGGVWFSGGDQSRLTAALLDTPLHARLRELYRSGGALGGTSAGAAVMSEVMITGDEKRQSAEGREWSTIEADNVVTTRGFGFLPGVIVDQHFIARRRHNRLLSLVLEDQDLIGLGIEESTAVLVRPDGRFEVLGENQVIVYDARRAKTARVPSGRLGARGMTLHVLVPGDVYDPVSGAVTSVASASPAKEAAR